MKKYFQCKLRQGTTETTGWIESRGARVGARVQLIPHEGLWEVLQVSGPPMLEELLKEHQRLHRGSLPSVERMQ